MDVSDGRMKTLNTRLSCAKRPAWPRWLHKHTIDRLCACAISWNLYCDDLVELCTKRRKVKKCKTFFGDMNMPVFFRNAKPVIFRLA